MGFQPLALTSPKHEENWKKGAEKDEIIGGVRYYRTGSVSTGTLPLVKEWRLMAALARRIHEVALVEKPNILHAHSPILNALPALWVGHNLGIPVVYEIRAFWEDAAVDHGTYGQNSWKYWLVKTVETWVCRKVNGVVLLCDGLKDDLINRGIPPNKLVVVSNGINIEDFRPCKPDQDYKEAWGLMGKRVIGFIGSFYRYEGLDLLVEAFASLSAFRSDIALLLVGGGEMEKELKEQINKLCLDGKVVMPGRIPHERIPGVYELIDILAYPRYSMRLTELVTPLKPLEAMAMGKAIVASDVGGHKELIKHNLNGLLFRAGNFKTLAASLNQLLIDTELCQRLQSESLKWVHECHMWGKTTWSYKEIYSEALK
jgi:PEP-CTERM/exosortase A-associated glycosyltransferase